MVLHRDFRRVFDLVDVQPEKRRQTRRRHGARAADLRLAAAFRAGNAGVGADHVADEGAHGQGVQYFIFGKAPVHMHVIQHRGQHAAAAAGGGGYNDMLIRVLLADGIGIGGDDPVHGHICAFVIAAFFKEGFRLAGHVEPAGQRALRPEPPEDGILHGGPDVPQGILQPGPLHPADKLCQGQVLLPAEAEDFRKIALGIDLPLLLRRFPFHPDGAPANAEDAQGPQGAPLPEGFKAHGIGVGQIRLLPVENHLRPRQAGADRFAGAVALAGKGQGTVQRNPEGIRLRIAAAEEFCGPVGADGMGTGRPVADFVDAFDAPQGGTSFLRRTQ